jgi:hypothetical protein
MTNYVYSLVSSCYRGVSCEAVHAQRKIKNYVTAASERGRGRNILSLQK